jgi:hypothetical protein
MSTDVLLVENIGHLKVSKAIQYSQPQHQEHTFLRHEHVKDLQRSCDLFEVSTRVLKTKT